MALPEWYLEQAKDYLAILLDAHHYTPGELRESTTKQRLAEYRLLRERLSGSVQQPAQPYEQQPYEQQTYEQQTYEQRSYEQQQPYERQQPVRSVLKPYDLKMMSIGCMGGPPFGPAGRGRGKVVLGSKVSRRCIWDEVLKP